MARRSGAVHVATIVSRQKGREYRTHLLRRSIRDGNRVTHQALGNVSHLPEPVIDLIRRALRGETFVSADAAFEIRRSLPHGHVAAVLGTLRKLGLDRLLSSRRHRQRDLAVALIAARVLEPESKLATARSLHPETARSTLGAVLGLSDADEDELYAAMDWLHARQPAIEKRLAVRHLSADTLVLYDVTSVWYTGRTCPLAAFGKPRDGKRDDPQIVFGLLCTLEGCPVAVEVFPGNTGDPTTLAPQIEKLRTRFALRRVVVVGDRGLLTAARIRDELAPVEGLEWVTALRAPTIAKLVEQGAIQRSLFDEVDLAEITSPDYPGERLVVCRNPLLADERARKRADLLAATEREFDKIVAATQRKRRPLRGEARIAARYGAVRNHYKVGKYFTETITDTSFSYERDEARIAADAALDGFYVIRTSVPAAELGSAEVVATYKGLATVERAFRSLKTVDLEVRPIRHRKADRVRAHVFLCMLAYYVAWHMRRALAPLLFDDDDRAAAEAARSSIVAPARRSAKAQRKARRKRTDAGEPVQSFQDLLGDLATLAKQRVGVPGTDAQFEQYTLPTALQQRAFDLLGVKVRM